MAQRLFPQQDSNVSVDPLELKIVKHLVERGFHVTIACRENEFINHDDDGINWFVHRGYPELILRAKELVLPGIRKLILVTMQPKAALTSLIVENDIRRSNPSIDVRQFHWVSHSRAFFFSNNPMVKALLRRVFFRLPPRSTAFMNDAAKSAHQAYWLKGLSEYPVIRIIGREPRAMRRSEGSGAVDLDDPKKAVLRIISVGRFVQFKSYNLYAASIVRRLLDAGVYATWDIFGYGPDEKKIAETIAKHRVSHYVRLLGTLPHDDFDCTVASYDVFVGMGTAVLEAARTGTPAIVGVENQRDNCYGFLHETPTDSVGDRVAGHPERQLYDVLVAFGSLGRNKRDEVGRSDAEAARQRASTLDEYADAILDAEQSSFHGFAPFAPFALLLFGRAYIRAAFWKQQRMRN